jgi:hypothetical protein
MVLITELIVVNSDGRPERNESKSLWFHHCRKQTCRRLRWTSLLAKAEEIVSEKRMSKLAKRKRKVRVRRMKSLSPLWAVGRDELQMETDGLEEEQKQINLTDVQN